ncbi:MupG family TIM beta-alpha barrel fold protein [Sulfolobus tengchongensis]|uniref:MupG family TIM beta-alpha barrel fold protein n=1 Tax=Sulfolobus tengchongensis TaxID=207809 RepID=A0AAX4L109_9CREN
MKRKIGLSVFPGWKEIKDEQIQVMRKARELGFSEIFMGIGPGTHWRTGIKDAFEIAKEILKEANRLDYYTFVDINPEILKELNSSPKNLSRFLEVGFRGVRADYGFSKEEIVEMSKQVIVELNPFEISVDELDYVTKFSNPERIKATHNYYPILYSGISKEVFLEKTKLFKERGIEIGAFISNPKFNLRTTLEILRFTEPFDSTNYLFNFVDRVLIGDPIPDEKTLRQVANVANSEITKIRITLYNDAFKDFINKVFHVENYREYAVVCYTKDSGNVTSQCYTKIFKNAVTVRGRELWIFTKDLGIGPYTLIGEIDDINLEILRMSKSVTFMDKK